MSTSPQRGERLQAGLGPEEQAAVAVQAVRPVAGVVGAGAADHCGENKGESVSPTPRQPTAHGGHFLRRFLVLSIFCF